MKRTLIEGILTVALLGLVGCIQSAPRPQFVDDQGLSEDASIGVDAELDVSPDAESDAGARSARCPDSTRGGTPGCDGLSDVGSSVCHDGEFEHMYSVCELDAENSCVDWVSQACPHPSDCLRGVCNETEQGAACGTTMVTNGTACEDDDPCFDGDTCQTGECVAGAETHCVDEDLCTVNTCHPETGACTFPDRDCRQPLDDLPPGQYSGCDNMTGECELFDLEACPEEGCDHPLDVECEQHGATSFPRNCSLLEGPRMTCWGWQTSADACSSEGLTCRQAACDPDEGGCYVVFEDPMVGCDDGDPCTSQTTCTEDGECVGPEICDDEDPCTANTCILGPNEGGQPVTCENPRLENPPMECN